MAVEVSVECCHLPFAFLLISSKSLLNIVRRTHVRLSCHVKATGPLTEKAQLRQENSCFSRQPTLADHLIAALRGKQLSVF